MLEAARLPPALSLQLVHARLERAHLADELQDGALRGGAHCVGDGLVRLQLPVFHALLERGRRRSGLRRGSSKLQALSGAEVLVRLVPTDAPAPCGMCGHRPGLHEAIEPAPNVANMTVDDVDDFIDERIDRGEPWFHAKNRCACGCGGYRPHPLARHGVDVPTLADDDYSLHVDVALAEGLTLKEHQARQLAYLQDGKAPAGKPRAP